MTIRILPFDKVNVRQTNLSLTLWTVLKGLLFSFVN
jgi:hypothetical protein